MQIFSHIMFLGNCLLIHIYLDTYQKDTIVADYEAKVLYVCNFSIQSYFISRRSDGVRIKGLQPSSIRCCRIQSGCGSVLYIGANKKQGVIASFQSVLKNKGKLVLPQLKSVVFHMSKLEATSHRFHSHIDIYSGRILNILSWFLRILKLLQVSASIPLIVLGIYLTPEMSGCSCLDTVNSH